MEAVLLVPVESVLPTFTMCVGMCIPYGVQPSFARACCIAVPARVARRAERALCLPFVWPTQRKILRGIVFFTTLLGSSELLLSDESVLAIYNISILECRNTYSVRDLCAVEKKEQPSRKYEKRRETGRGREGRGQLQDVVQICRLTHLISSISSSINQIPNTERMA